MPQLTYDNPTLKAGIAQHIERLVSLRNTRTVQVVNWDINSGTTDGTYTINLYDPTGVDLLASASFVASSNTAAQIAAGVVAAILADQEWRGFVSACAVVNTDQLNITFRLQQHNVNYVVRKSTATPSGPTDPTNSTNAGLTRIGIGRILQSSGSGAFSTTYSDAAMALGVTYRSPAAEQPDDFANPVSIGDADFNVIARGTVSVTVADGVTVYQGDKVYYNSTAVTYSNASSGSHVLVEGAQWQTSGTSVQVVYVNLPSET